MYMCGGVEKGMILEERKWRDKSLREHETGSEMMADRTGWQLTEALLAQQPWQGMGTGVLSWWFLLYIPISRASRQRKGFVWFTYITVLWAFFPFFLWRMVLRKLLLSSNLIRVVNKHLLIKRIR